MPLQDTLVGFSFVVEEVDLCVYGRGRLNFKGWDFGFLADLVCLLAA